MTPDEGRWRYQHDPYIFKQEFHSLRHSMDEIKSAVKEKESAGAPNQTPPTARDGTIMDS
jgi:hypothetical protein